MQAFARTYGSAPRFEDQDVQGYRMKLGATTLDLDFPLLIDEKVEIVLVGRVVGVHHDVNQATGALIRRHIVKIDSTDVKESQ